MSSRYRFNQWNDSSDGGRGASQAIEVTIQGIESRMGVKFPRGSSPSESREIMYERLEVLFVHLLESSRR